jgi:hypothetical protein
MRIDIYGALQATPDIGDYQRDRNGTDDVKRSQRFRWNGPFVARAFAGTTLVAHQRRKTRRQCRVVDYRLQGQAASMHLIEIRCELWIY